MEGEGDWSASALFSPSKARAQQAQAGLWTSVDSWLAKTYSSGRVPAFERNEQTLQALLTLAALNQSADEQRELRDRVERAALQALSKRLSHPTDDLVPMLLAELGDCDAIQVLPQIQIDLESGSTDPVMLGAAIADLTWSRFETAQRVRRVDASLAALRTEQSRLQRLLADLDNETFQPPPGLAEQTAEWARSTKQLKVEAGEYEERLSALRSTSTSTLLLDKILQEQMSAHDLDERLREMTAELRAYQSLPPDAATAQTRLEDARETLRDLVQRRDGMLEDVAGSR